MKRIIAISTLAIATLIGFSSAANAAADTDTSIHTGAVASVCSVKATPGDFVTDGKLPVNGVDFPTSLKSTGGKFETLCNKATNSIIVENTGTNVLPTGAGAPTVTYTLNTPTGGYVNNTILAADTAIATPTTGTVDHGFTAATSNFGVVVKVAAPATKILQEGTYTVAIKTTLTP
jgi:hypothetical protein